jgi:hypothetical protein
MRRLIAVLVVALAAASAQTHTPSPSPAAVVAEATGSVTGRVFCGDTNQPARFAHVSLEAIRDPAAPAALSSASPAPATSVGGITSVETTIDGSFTLTKVKPGAYYVIVSKQGYVSPRAMFTQKEITDPSPDMRSIIDHALPRVQVENNQTEHAEVRLERGGAVSGAILYDDGSPAGELSVQLLHKDATGKWVPIGNTFGIRSGGWANTDDRGQFRFASLLPDDYIVQATLSLSDTKESSIPGPGGHSMQLSMAMIRFSLPFYGSGVTRLADAKSFTLAAGQELTGQDMTLPIARLHRLTGRVVAGANGHVVNAANVALIQGDDKKEFATADISREDGLFHFDFVPDGDYTLRITSARDVVWEAERPAPNAPLSPFPAQDKERVIETYGGVDQPLILRGDMLGITATVPLDAKKPDSKPKPSEDNEQ